jgi:hypothetical protein
MQLSEIEGPPPTHIDGRAGCGKTYVLYPLIGALRKANHIVLVSASSAFAAKNYPGGRTTHYLYGIPVDEFKPFLQSAIHPNTQRGHLLLAAKCHIIDEIGSLHYKAFDCADRLMRSLTHRPHQIWGGCMLITLGDFHQVCLLHIVVCRQSYFQLHKNAPVVHYGGRSAITKASIRTQPIFNHFEILQLHASIRQATDPDFANFLNSVGDDFSHDTVDLARFPHSRSLTAVLNFVFPPEVVSQPHICVQRAILSPFNFFVDEINLKILHRLQGDSKTYFSSDHIEGDLDDEEEESIATPDLLNSLHEPGIPDHELILKIGSVCRFTRNFDASKGLTKNTRVIVTNFFRYSVEVQTLPDIVAGEAIESVSC